MMPCAEALFALFQRVPDEEAMRVAHAVLKARVAASTFIELGAGAGGLLQRPAWAAGDAAAGGD